MNRYHFAIIPIAIMLMPVIYAIIQAKRAEREKKRWIAEKEAREAARREALRKAKAEREAAKAAEAAAKAAQPKRKPGRPRKTPVAAPAERPENISPAKPAPVAPVAEPAQSKPATYAGNNAFAGQTVAFTGTIPGMTRREAIAAVEKNGGRAFESMPAATTLLVVGDKPGMRKLDKADEWPSVRKITAAEFIAMCERPLTLEPDEFEKFFLAWAARKAA